MTTRDGSPGDPPEGHGPHGGPLVTVNGGFVEISVFETRVPPRFRLYFFDERRQPWRRRLAPPRSRPSDLTAGGSRLPFRSAMGSSSPRARFPSPTSSASSSR